MVGSYLEVTFRQGRAFAAYLYFERRPGERSYRTAKAEPGLVVDFAEDGRPIGIEITAPSTITLAAVNRALRGLGLPEMEPSDLAPLPAA
jgi:hypothetical protein